MEGPEVPPPARLCPSSAPGPAPRAAPPGRSAAGGPRVPCRRGSAEGLLPVPPGGAERGDRRELLLALSTLCPSERAADTDVPVCPRAGTAGARWLLIRVHLVLPARNRLRGDLGPSPGPLPAAAALSGVCVHSRGDRSTPAGTGASPFRGTVRGSLPHPGSPPADTRPWARNAAPGAAGSNVGRIPPAPAGVTAACGTESDILGWICVCVCHPAQLRLTDAFLTRGSGDEPAWLLPRAAPSTQRPSERRGHGPGRTGRGCGTAARRGGLRPL